MLDSNRRLAIAKELAEKVFQRNLSEEVKETRYTDEDLKQHERYQRTLKLISEPKNINLYSMEIERQLISSSKLCEALDLIQRQSLRQAKTNIKILVKKLRQALKSALFGCEVYIGLCIDASMSVVEFNDDNDYVRKVIRGKSTCFECLDQKDVVLQASSIEESNTSIQSLQRLSPGESIVYVPLLGKGSGIGIIEIHGLLTEGITELSNFERSSNFVKSMIAAEDFSFIDSMRLWRLPGSRSGGTVSPMDRKDYNKSNYQLVCGHVIEVVNEKNGVEYFGGPRYTISWEDGLVEEAVTATELIQVYKQTPHSLGCSSVFDTKLADDLLTLGQKAGEVLENQRRSDTVKELKLKMHVPNLKDDTMGLLALDAVLSVAHGIRDVSIFGVDGTGKVLNILQKSPLLRPKAKGLQYTAKDIIEMFKNPTLRPSAKLKTYTRHKSAIDMNVATNEHNIKSMEVEDGLVQWICCNLPVNTDFRWLLKDTTNEYFVIMTRMKHPDSNAATLDVLCFESILCILANGLNDAWYKLMRKKNRTSVIKSIEKIASEYSMLEESELCQRVLDALVDTLPGCDMYCAVLQRDLHNNPDLMRYIAANSSSAMKDRILARGEGISYEVMESKDTVVIKAEDLNKRKLLGAGSVVDVFYGKVKYRARIKQNRGHGCYDVDYVNGEKEAGVSVDRIIPVHTAFKLKRFENAVFPFVCVPIRNREKGLGIIGVDNFQSVPKARYDPQPEPMLITFLESVGRVLGAAIDKKRKSESLHMLSTAMTNFNIKLENISEEVYILLQKNLLYMSTFVTSRILYEKLLNRKMKKTVDIVFQRGVLSEEEKGWLEAYDSYRSSQKPIQKKGLNVIWLLFKNRPDEKGGQGKVFIFHISQPIPIKEIDIEFLTVLYKLISTALQNLDNRKIRIQRRLQTLKEIKTLCERERDKDNTYKTEKRLEIVFSELYSMIQQCYFFCNVYVGKLTPHNIAISFILANSTSRMFGKRLTRISRRGICFDAIDELKHIYVPENSPLTRRLFHFGRVEDFNYPYVVMPIISYVDSIQGVLCVDNCNEVDSGVERSHDLISFFSTVTSYWSTLMKDFEIAQAKKELNTIIINSRNFFDGIRQIKKVLLSLLPSATRVAEVCYEPKEVDFLKIHDVFGRQAALTTEDFVVFIRILKVECLSDSIKNAFVSLLWLGQTQVTCKCEEGTDADVALKIFVPKGVDVHHLSLQIVLKVSIVCLFIHKILR